MKDEKEDKPAVEKSFSFVSRIVKLYQHLSNRNRFRLPNASKFNIIHTTQKTQKNAEGKQDMNKYSSFISRHSSMERKHSFTLIELLVIKTCF